MKIIQEPAPATRLVCGSQKETAKEPYRRTTLCVEAACDEGTLLYHTLTGMLILLDKEDVPEAVREELIKNWFLVPESFNDAAFADQCAGILRLLQNKPNEKKGIKSFTILTTTDCNARCYYCYEAGVSRKTMSAETAGDVAEHIARVSGGGSVELRWFGGEPLLNTKAMDIICRRLGEKGIHYRSLMITNGYYLDGAAAEKAVELWHLQKVQITLDGTAEVYNRVKAYAEGGDAYDRVLGNIETALDAGITVAIRLHVGNHNAEELLRLCEELAGRFRGRRNLCVQPALIGNFKGRTRRFRIESGTANTYLAVGKAIQEAGLSTAIPLLERELRIIACEADNDECEIILPGGELCRCGHELERECCGSIYSEERDEARISSWKEQMKLPECPSCALYPRCLNLKKCAWVNTSCKEDTRIIRMEMLRERMLEAYHRQKGALQ